MWIEALLHYNKKISHILVFIASRCHGDPHTLSSFTKTYKSYVWKSFWTLSTLQHGDAKNMQWLIYRLTFPTFFFSILNYLIPQQTTFIITIEILVSIEWQIFFTAYLNKATQSHSVIPSARLYVAVKYRWVRRYCGTD